MLRFILVLVAAIGFGAAARAQSGPIEAVIAQQFEDFRADDFGAAFEHASPFIQGVFQSPENFGMMVRQGYPMVWRPEVFRFLDLRADEAGSMKQRVEVEDGAGARHLLEYDMIEVDGAWKVNGVIVIPAPGVAA